MPICRNCNYVFDNVFQFSDHILLSKCLEKLRQDKGVKHVWIMHYDQLKFGVRIERELDDIINNSFFSQVNNSMTTDDTANMDCS